MGEVFRCRYGSQFRDSVFFYQFSSTIGEKYPELFEGYGNAPSQHQYNFGKKYGAYTSIIQLAQGDIRYIDAVTEEPLEKVLLFLAYHVDKQIMEELLHNEAMSKMNR